MELTKSVFQRMFPKASAANIEKYYAAIIAGMEKFGINTPQRMAMFLANLAHESMLFARVSENLNYRSAERLVEIFPKYFKNVSAAAPYVGNPEKLANRVYGGRMGNGPEASGDGWKYRGRGLIGTTGRENYEKTGRALGIDLVNHPELLEQPVYAAYSACWFWQWQKLNELADAGEFDKVCRRINGGTIGLADRQTHYSVVRKIFGL